MQMKVAILLLYAYVHPRSFVPDEVLKVKTTLHHLAAGRNKRRPDVRLIRSLARSFVSGHFGCYPFSRESSRRKMDAADKTGSYSLVRAIGSTRYLLHVEKQKALHINNMRLERG